MFRESPVRLDTQAIKGITDEIITRIPGDTGSIERIVRSLENPYTTSFVLLSNRVHSRNDLVHEVPVMWSGTYLEAFPEVFVGNGCYRHVVAVGAFRNFNEDTLHVIEMVLGKSYRNHGIGTAVYAKLESMAKANSYRYIVGYSSSPQTRGYFLNRGRYGSWEILSNKRSKFADLYARENANGQKFTISFLCHGDVKRFVRPSHIR